VEDNNLEEDDHEENDPNEGDLNEAIPECDWRDKWASFVLLSCMIGHTAVVSAE